MKVHEETWSGVYGSATRETAWLAIDAYADLVSGDTFRLSDIAAGRQDVFLNIPMKDLLGKPTVARVIIGTIIEAVYEAYRSIRKRVLFLLDDAVLLGRMDILLTVRDHGRKHKVSLVTMWQDLGQLEDIWGEKQRRAWFGSSSWVTFAAISDWDTAKLISAMAGKYTTIVRTEGKSDSMQNDFSRGSKTWGTNYSESEGEADLIRPEEITQRMRTDEAIVFPRGRRPIRCGRAIAFRRPEMHSRFSEDPLRKAA
jgi:type IV secretion system protein VirD4